MLKVRQSRFDSRVLIGGSAALCLLLVAALGMGQGAGASDPQEAGSPASWESGAPQSHTDPAGIAKTGTVAVAALEQASVFPLMIREGERYLVDAAGKPFLLHGDTAWSLIGELTREEAELYLEDRRRRGFNTILVNLIEHRFSTRAPANAYGQAPFLVGKDFSTPNEEYFAHAEWILRRAEEKGLLVLLAPAYIGNGGGAEGWYRAMKASGPSKLQEYGRFLGRRFGGFTNILWVHGGDYNPPDKDLVRAVADGIREFDRDALHTAHGSPGSAAIEHWAGEEWLQVNNVYTYESVRRAALQQYRHAEQLPFILFESAYENEHGASEFRLRKQAYQALLAGAAGHIFGNNPIWHFSGPGIYPAAMSWQEALASRGAQSMTHLWELFSGLEWWRLEPSRGLMVDSPGYGDEQPMAARAADGSAAVIYLPSTRHVTLDLSELAGPRITARWFDPASGQFSMVAGTPLPAEGFRGFRPPGTNSANLPDWVLVLNSRP